MRRLTIALRSAFFRGKLVEDQVFLASRQGYSDDRGGYHIENRTSEKQFPKQAGREHMTTTTDQEVFWQGNFGNDYTDRNRGPGWIASNVAFFSKVLDRTCGVRSVLELGSNIGLNLMALKYLLPGSRFSAVEINQKAVSELQENLPEIDLHFNSILEFQPSTTWDLVFTKGVLIHINPDKLSNVYELIYQSSSQYVLLSEYYNPNPIEVTYRGYQGKLFKRDFAGDMLDAFPDLSLVEYGFVYHRDPNFPQDDLTWFLMKKK